MIPFIEAPRFNTEIRYGTIGGPEFSTDIVTVTSGAEQRNSNWLDSRGKWQVADDMLNTKEMSELIAFFRNRLGRAGGFRFKDWSDYQAKALPNGFKEGILVPVDNAPGVLQLVKTYGDQLLGNYITRVIAKPVQGTIRLFDRNGEVYGPNIDHATGRVYGASTDLLWTGEFDVPARFDSDQFNSNFQGYRDADREALFTVSGLTIVELSGYPPPYIPDFALAAGLYGGTLLGGVFLPSTPFSSTSSVTTGGVTTTTTTTNTSGGANGVGASAVINVTPLADPLVASTYTTAATATLSTGDTWIDIKGGSGLYQYQWTQVDGDPGITINHPTSEVTSFTATLNVSTYKYARFSLRVTDSNGATAVSLFPISVRMDVFYGSAVVSAPPPPNTSGPLTVQISQASLNTVSVVGVPVTLVSPRIYAYPSGGGYGYYQYFWEYVSGDKTIIPDDYNASNVTFSAALVPGETRVAVYDVLVNNIVFGSGSYAYSVPFTITLSLS